MTEASWIACIEPEGMIQYLWDQAGDRKRRLFMVACCHRFWDVLLQDGGRSIVQAYEDHADGIIDQPTFRGTISQFLYGSFRLHIFDYQGSNERIHEGLASDTEAASMAVGDLNINNPYSLISDTLDVASIRAMNAHLDEATYRSLTDETYQAALAEWAQPAKLVEEHALVDLVREIFGNPLRPKSIDPYWLAWNSRTIPRIALAIYEDKSFADMPILGDALEEAGCHDSDILDHCRSKADHVRGCWVLDVLLGKR